MKYLLTIIILFLIVSCKHKEKEKINLNYFAVKITHDTSLAQNVWAYAGEYWVETLVKTDAYQEEYGYPYLSISAPYKTVIHGTFEYVKNNKLKEYYKAKHYYDSIKLASRKQYPIMVAEHIRDSLQKDSVKYLMDIK